MKRNCSIIACLSLLLLPAVAVANPIVIVPSEFGTIQPELLYLTVATALATEYLFIRLLFRKSFSIWRILPAFVLINAFTVPMTNFLAITWGSAAELFPLGTEPLLYWLYFRSERVYPTYSAVKIIAANLASFLVGCALLRLLALYDLVRVLR
jgi:hypothetical protein